MSQTTTSQSDLQSMFRVLQESHMTAIVDTESGSRYTVVARPEVGVVLIKDTAGWAVKAPGGRINVINGKLFLYDADGKIVARTTRITDINILSN